MPSRGKRFEVFPLKAMEGKWRDRAVGMPPPPWSRGQVFYFGILSVMVFDMARPLRIEFPGALYHLTAQANAQQPIFRDDRDRHGFLQILGKTLSDCNGICHAYCLMTNHYHLLMETPVANLSRIMKQINGIYTQRFNRRHQRLGHVLQGRFKSILVDKDAYLLELCRYIVLNPLRAGMTHDPGRYRWSSFKATADMVKTLAFLSTDWILRRFAKTRPEAQAQYRRFVWAGKNEPSPWKALKGQCLLGGKEFVAKLSPHLKEKGKIKEIRLVDRKVLRPDLALLFSDANRAMRTAHFEHGYRQKEIADHLGLHYTTESNILRTIR
jgi:REP element-mobilizing transposase RayT